jgi:putative ABC transport system substrate-binding protein
MQSSQLRRREFISLFGSAAAWPLAVQAQQPAMPVIAVLGASGGEEYLQGFRQSLSEAGYIEGESVAIVYRFADNQLDRLPALADELVRRHVAVIATIQGIHVALAAKGATEKLMTA